MLSSQTRLVRSIEANLWWPLTAPSSQWRDVHKTFDALFPEDYAAHKASDTLADRFERLEVPSAKDLSSISDVIDALSVSLDWVKSYGTILQLPADTDSTPRGGRPSSGRHSSDAFDDHKGSVDDLEHHIDQVFSGLCPRVRPKRDSSPSATSFHAPRTSADSTWTEPDAEAEDVPTYIKMSLQHVEIEALEYYELPWEYCSVSPIFHAQSLASWRSNGGPQG